MINLCSKVRVMVAAICWNPIYRFVNHCAFYKTLPITFVSTVIFMLIVRILVKHFRGEELFDLGCILSFVMNVEYLCQLTNP